MNLTPSQISLLQALRAGPCSAEQLSERFGRWSPLASLAAAGLVIKAARGGLCRLTAAGERACPPRNPAAAQARRVPPPQGADVRGPTTRLAATKFLDRPFD